MRRGLAFTSRVYTRIVHANLVYDFTFNLIFSFLFGREIRSKHYISQDEFHIELTNTHAFNINSLSHNTISFKVTGNQTDFKLPLCCQPVRDLHTENPGSCINCPGSLYARHLDGIRHWALPQLFLKHRSIHI